MKIRTVSGAKLCTYLLLIIATPCLVGCGSGNVNFTQNKVSSRVMELQGGVDEGLSRNLYQQITNIMGAMFGTPDSPTLMAGGMEAGLVDLDNLTRAAGASLRSVCELHKPGSSENRQSEGLQYCGDEHCPDREWQTEHRHSGSTHLDDCGHVVHGSHHR